MSPFAFNVINLKGKNTPPPHCRRVKKLLHRNLLHKTPPQKPLTSLVPRKGKKWLEAAMHRELFDCASEFAGSKSMFACKLAICARLLTS